MTPSPLTVEQREDLEDLEKCLRKYGMIANAQQTAPAIRALLALVELQGREIEDKKQRIIKDSLDLNGYRTLVTRLESELAALRGRVGA